jgi:hypothetical protein
VVARPSRLSEVLPVGEWSDAEHGLELQSVQTLKGRAGRIRGTSGDELRGRDTVRPRTPRIGGLAAPMPMEPRKVRSPGHRSSSSTNWRW